MLWDPFIRGYKVKRSFRAYSQTKVGGSFFFGVGALSYGSDADRSFYYEIVTPVFSS